MFSLPFKLGSVLILAALLLSALMGCPTQKAFAKNVSFCGIKGDQLPDWEVLVAGETLIFQANAQDAFIRVRKADFIWEQDDFSAAARTYAKSLGGKDIREAEGNIEFITAQGEQAFLEPHGDTALLFVTHGQSEDFYHVLGSIEPDSPEPEADQDEQMQEILDAVSFNDTTDMQNFLTGDRREQCLTWRDAHGGSLLDYAVANSMPLFAGETLNLLLKHNVQWGSEPEKPAMALSRGIICGKSYESIPPDDINTTLPNGMTPFLWAAAAGSPQLAERMIKAGANLRQVLPEDSGIIGCDALMLAAACNPDPGMVKLLLAHGIDVNSKNSLTGNALITACLLNTAPGVAMSLINAGADVNECSGVSGTAFQYAARHAGATPLLNALKEKGADIFACDDGGNTALHEAARSNTDSAVLRYLLDLGLQVNTPMDEEAEESTPLMLAAEHNPSPEIIKMLLDAGADANQKDMDGLTACQRVQPERAHWLKENGLYERICP